MEKVYTFLDTRKVAFLLFFLISVPILAQRTVSGTVTEENSTSGLPGVSVVVKGSTRGTVTDANGKYSIPAQSDSDVLIFSFVGYQSMEVPVGNRSVIDLSLQSDVSTLQEIVVTGYAAQQKKNITGSIAIVDTKEMTKLAASNFADQLQGKVAGVQMSTSGDPGSAAFVRIRGIGTINNNEPLYVVDGVPIQNETNLNWLNPNDIESMQVLKDAASASI